MSELCSAAVRFVRLFCPIDLEPEREAKAANATLLEQGLRLGAVEDPGDLDQRDFERNAHGLIVLGDSQSSSVSPAGRRDREAAVLTLSTLRLKS